MNKYTIFLLLIILAPVFFVSGTRVAKAVSDPLICFSNGWTASGLTATISAGLSGDQSNDNPVNFAILWGDSPTDTSSGNVRVNAAGVLNPITHSHAYSSPGSYTVQWQFTSFDGDFCEVDYGVTVTSGSLGTLIVTSNLSTCFVATGPDNVSDCISSGTSYFYSVAAGSYTVTPDSLTGYTYTVSPNPASVSSGGSASVTITYTSTGGGGSGGPGAPNCNPTSQSVYTGETANLTASGGNGTFTWSAPGGSPNSGSGSSFSTSYAGTGSQNVTVTSGGLNATCIVNVSSPPPPAGPGSVQVNSNQPTSWTITGPGLSDSPSGLTSKTYANQTAGSYSLSGVPATLPGYTLSSVTANPSDNTLTNGNTLVYTIFYAANSIPSCTDSAALSFTTPLPATLVAGQTYNFIIHIVNTGDTVIYSHSTNLFPYVLDQEGSTSSQFSRNNPSALAVPVPGVTNMDQGVGGSLQPGWTGDVNYTLTIPSSFPIGGPYTLAWQMLEVNPVNADFYSKLGTESGPDCSGNISPISPPQGNQVPFGNVLSTSVTITNKGILQVNCPSPSTTWTVSGGVGSGSSPSQSYSVSPGTYTVTFANVAKYNNNAPTVNVTLAAGETKTANCNFSPQPLTTPTITGIDNSTCSQLTVSWSDDITNVDHFEIWRSTTSGSETHLIDKATSVTSYTDTGLTAGQTYYYIIKAVETSPPQTTQSTESHATVQSCNANLNLSVKNLAKVQKGGSGSFAAYDPGTMTISDGDVLRFTITIINTGNASATINNVIDTMTANLYPPDSCPDGGTASDFCLEVDKGSGASAGTLSSLGGNQYKWNAASASKCTSNGDPSCKNWVLQFDAKLQALTSNLDEFFKNTGDINYTDASGTHDKIVTYGPVLFKKTSSNVPTFKEVSP